MLRHILPCFMILCVCQALSCGGEDSTPNVVMGECSWCGDGACCPPETATSCLNDCGSCGDGYCAWQERSCPEDCGVCGDGICSRSESGGPNPIPCAEDCPTCGDNVCSPLENSSTCPFDCFCGDKTCSGDEATTCPEDCGGNACLSPVADTDCGMCSTRNNCVNCCDSLHPGAAGLYGSSYRMHCLCDVGGICGTLCQMTQACDHVSPPTQVCSDCIMSIPPDDPCVAAALADCHADASCHAWKTCNAPCDGLP